MHTSDPLIAGSACVIVTQCAATLSTTPHALLPIILMGLTQLIALLILWWLVRDPERFQQGRWRLCAYAAALFAVFAPSSTEALMKWIWLPRCGTATNAIASSNADLVLERGLTTVLASLIFARLLQSIAHDNSAARQKLPSRTSVAALACMVYLPGWLIANVLLDDNSVKPWCERLTSSGLNAGAQIFADIISGPMEEFAYTGFALVLLAGCRWRIAAAGVAVNVVMRTLGHLYYADHHTLAWWALWVLVWSGGPLSLALWTIWRARQAQLSTRRLTLTYTVTVVATHSLTDLLGLKAIAILWVVLLSATYFAAIFYHAHRPFHWLVERHVSDPA